MTDTCPTSWRHLSGSPTAADPEGLLDYACAKRGHHVCSLPAGHEAQFPIHRCSCTHITDDDPAEFSEAAA